MVRKKQQGTITAKMYKHFAVVTLVITGSVALFADGESREAIADEIAQHERDKALQRADAERNGPPKLAVRKPLNARVYDSYDNYSDTSGANFGDATDLTGREAEMTGTVIAAYQANNGSMPPWDKLGLTRAQWEALSPQEQSELLQRGDPLGTSAPETRADMIASITAASAARAGGDGGDGDGPGD